MELKISPAARETRETIVAHADLKRAAELAEGLSSHVIDSLNAADVQIATHLVSLALVARALVQTGGEWMSSPDVNPDIPPPESYAAMFDIAVNLPIEIHGESYDVRTGRRI